MIGGDRDVRDPALEHAKQRPQNPAHRSNFAPLSIARRRHSVVVTKKLVSSIHEINFQRDSNPKQEYEDSQRIPATKQMLI